MRNTIITAILLLLLTTGYLVSVYEKGSKTRLDAPGKVAGPSINGVLLPQTITAEITGSDGQVQTNRMDTTAANWLKAQKTTSKTSPKKATKALDSLRLVKFIHRMESMTFYGTNKMPDGNWAFQINANDRTYIAEEGKPFIVEYPRGTKKSYRAVSYNPATNSREDTLTLSHGGKTFDLIKGRMIHGHVREAEIRSLINPNLTHLSP